MSTHSITGRYTGIYNIVVRPTEGTEAGKTQSGSGLADDPIGYGTWTWNFDAGTVTLEDGRLARSNEDTTASPDSCEYQARKAGDQDSVELVLGVVDAGEGRYEVTYDWKIQPGIDGSDSSEAKDASIPLEITKLKDGSIAVVTVLNEGNGIPGNSLPDFPVELAPDWRGRAIPA